MHYYDVDLLRLAILAGAMLSQKKIAFNTLACVGIGTFDILLPAMKFGAPVPAQIPKRPPPAPTHG
jgi:hypothetical protein